MASKSLLILTPDRAPPADCKKASIAISHPRMGSKSKQLPSTPNNSLSKALLPLPLTPPSKARAKANRATLKIPSQRVEDIKSAVIYMSTIAKVDPNRISHTYSLIVPTSCSLSFSDCIWCGFGHVYMDVILRLSDMHRTEGIGGLERVEDSLRVRIR
jgi:hypothetical protein